MCMDLEEIVDDLEAVRSITDPLQRARALTVLVQRLPEISAAVRAARQEAVQQLHASGMSWAQIGDAIGLHPMRASQIGRGVTGGREYRRAAAARDQDEGEGL